MWTEYRYAALESLQLAIYTVASECWTFGIILWELFMLAQSAPYDKELTPSFNIEQLKTFLVDGNRLAPPDTAPYPM
jgi:hypothetical protein